MLISNMLMFAQGIYIDIENHPSNMRRCLGDNETFYVNAQNGCEEGYEWVVDGNVIQNQSPIVITPSEHSYAIEYFGCEGFYHFFTIQYVNTTAPETFTQVEWGLPGQGTTFHATIDDGYNTYNWQNGGPNSYSYEVFSPGIYPCEVTNPCGSATQTFIRYDMARIDVARVDPVTGQIVLEWDGEESVLQNASTIKIFCDDTTNMVGIADISDEIWVDATTQSTGARNYWCRTVANSGEESPLWGPIQTIFASTIPTTNPNKAIAIWNLPQGYDPFTWFRLNQVILNGKDEPMIIPIDSVAATENMIEFDIALIEGTNNKVNIEAVFSNEKARKVAPCSNSLGAEDVLDVIENIENEMQIYPNPAKGQINVYGEGDMIITNIIGQELLRQQVNGHTTVTMHPGRYLVRLGKKSKWVIVE